MGTAMEHWAQLQQICSFLYPALNLGFCHACNLQRGGNIVKNAHMGIVDEELMHQRDVALLGILFCYIHTIHQDRAGRTAIKTGHQLDQRCLTGSGFAEQDIEMSRL